MFGQPCVDDDVPTSNIYAPQKHHHNGQLLPLLNHPHSSDFKFPPGDLKIRGVTAHST